MSQSAAFFRVEGTLLELQSVMTAAYFAANASGFGERLARLGNVALAAPLRLAGELQVGASATKVTWMGLRGMSEDRLVTLADEYFEKYIEDKALDIGLDLVKQAKKQGRRVVLISDSIDLVMTRFAESLGVEDLICNRLEMRNGKATGKLEEPVVGGNVSGQWARAFAAENDIDLLQSWAYGAAAADSLLLSAIGQPCVVNPDRQLRRLAKDHEWPVVEK